MIWLWMALACTSDPGSQKADTGDSDETDDGGTDSPYDTDSEDDTDDSDAESDQPLETAETDLPEPGCELGTGEEQWEPLVDGQDLMQVRGPQGLWHVYGSVRCHGIVPGDVINPLNPDNPIITWKLDDCGKVIAGYENLPRPMNQPEGAELIGEVLVFRTRTYEETVGKTYDLIFHLEDATGVVIDIRRTVRVVGEPGDTDFTVDTGQPVIDTGCAR